MSTDLFGNPITEEKPAPVGPIQKLKAHLKYREGTKTKCCETCKHWKIISTIKEKCSIHGHIWNSYPPDDRTALYHVCCSEWQPKEAKG